MFQNKDRVTRNINDGTIELLYGLPRIYVIKKNKNKEIEVDSLYSYPEVRINADGLVVRTNEASKWNLGDKVFFHHADISILDET